MFGAKTAKQTHNNVVDANGRCDVVASDFYVSQLRDFIAKNSNASFDCRKHQQKQVAEHQHQIYLPNSSEPKNQHKDFKRKCKRAFYKFMKGLLDERKFKKIKSISEQEPIYFEVSLFSFIMRSGVTDIYVTDMSFISRALSMLYCPINICCKKIG